MNLWEFGVLIDLALRNKPDPVGTLPDGITDDGDYCYSSEELAGSVGTIVRFNENPEILRSWADNGFDLFLPDYATTWGW